MSVNYWENSASVNTVRVYCDQTIKTAQLYIKATQRTVTVKTDCIYWIDVSKTSTKALEIGSEILLKKVVDIRGNAVYGADGLWVYTSDRGTITYSNSNNMLGTAKQGNPGLQINIGMDWSEKPEIGPADYEYVITFGKDITGVQFTYIEGDSQYIQHLLATGKSGENIDGNGNIHYYDVIGEQGTWSSGTVSWGSFIIQAVYAGDTIVPLILVNDTTYKTNYWSVTGTKGATLDLYIMTNPTYTHYFKCLSGITSYDVYKVDLMAETDTKLLTVESGKTKSSALYYRYQSVYLTNFKKQTDEYIFNVYEDTDGKTYQSAEVSSSGYLTDNLWITSEPRKRYIQVEGTAPKYTCGIMLGDGISSCDVQINGEGETISVSYTDGYKLKYKTFEAYAIDTIHITNIKVDSTAYIHPYTLTMCLPDSEIPMTEVTLESGDSASYPVYTEYPYCIISATENLNTVRIETTGIDSCMIYAGGTYVGKMGTSTDTGASDTLNVQPGELIEIPPFDALQRSIISLTTHYDPSKYVISFYRKDETDPYWTGAFDYSKGAAFNADDDHYKVTIVGALYDKKYFNYRTNESIAARRIIVDDITYNIVNTPESYVTANRWFRVQVYPDSGIVFKDIYSASTSDYRGPVVVKFYQDYSNDSKLETLETVYSDAKNVVTFSITATRLCCELSMSVPKFSWYDADADDSKIVKGAQVSANLTAERWNKLQAKIALMYKVNGRIFNSRTGSPETTYSYTDVKSKKIIYATLFNAVVKAINELPGHLSMPSPNKGTGATVYAEYFQGGLGRQGYSIKDALNAAIDYFNGNT